MNRFLLILMLLTTVTFGNLLHAQCDISISYQQDPTMSNNVWFSAYVLSPDSSILTFATYTWSFGDGTTSTEAAPMHTYNEAGTYFVCATAATAFGCAATTCDSVYVGIAPPPSCSAYFSYFSTGIVGTLQFFTSPDSETTNFAWDFGDGNTSGEANPTHTFASGTYNVCLSVSTADGCSDAYCDMVSVSGIPIDTLGCAAIFSWMINADGSILFTSSSVAAAPILSTIWDFGDGVTAMGETVSHTYNALGFFEVCLTIMSGTPGTTDFCTDQNCQFVGGSGTEECVASYIYDYDPASGGLQFYDQSYSTQPINSWLWELSDGSTFTEQNPFHPGAFDSPMNVCLTIQSGTAGTADFCGNTFCSTIWPINDTIVFPDFCDAFFTANPSVTNALDYQFDGNSGAVGAIVSEWVWDFGDGSSATEQNPTHLFAEAGVFNVCLTTTTIAADGTACSDQFCMPLNVGQVFGPLCGFITASDSPGGGLLTTLADFMTVYLIQFDPVANTLTAMDSISLTPDMQGYFCFDSLMVGDTYLIKAAMLPESSNYNNYIPTYYINSLTWNTATAATVGNATLQLIMTAGENPGGPGFIGGNISDGAGKAGSTGIPNVTVLVLDANSNPVAYTYTDAEGNYQFPNLPYGTYTIVVDMLNYTSVPFSVTLSADNPTANEVNFEPNGTELIAADPLAGGSVVEELVEPDVVLLLPSVVNDWTIIHVNSAINTTNANIYVHNAMGGLVHSRRVTLSIGGNSFWLNALNFAPGQYSVSVIANGSFLGSARFLKL